MHIKRNFGVFMLLALSVLCAFFFTGCSKTDVDAQNEAIQKAVEEALKEQEAKQKQEAAAAEAEPQANEEAVDYGYTVEDDGLFSFANVADQEFWACTDEGVWNILLMVSEDGTFQGFYQEADYEETGASYPNGTVYICDFTGGFTEPIKLNDYTYLCEVSWLECENEIGAHEFIDGVHYINTPPHGVTEGGNIHFYLPGAPLDGLSEDYIESVGYGDSLQEAGAALACYGLFDVSLDFGFTGYYPDAGDLPEIPPVEIKTANEAHAEKETSDTPSIDERIASAEYSEKELLKRLEKNTITQSEMNEVAANVYQIWCDQLDWMLDEMEAWLDPAAMDTIKTEQREWEAKRERAMQKAGAEVEGGSMQPMLEATEGAEQTKMRVYELAGWLR